MRRFISELILIGVVIILFFFNDTATTEIYTLSLHDALPILRCADGDVVHDFDGDLAPGHVLLVEVDAGVAARPQGPQEGESRNDRGRGRPPRCHGRSSALRILAFVYLLEEAP